VINDFEVKKIAADNIDDGTTTQFGLIATI
jgi:hypothetical protein